MSRESSTWQQRSRPPRLEGRFEFADYGATRDFLDGVADLCEAAGYYPDISFGRTYVNITIRAEDGAAEVSSARADVAHRIDTLVKAAD